ncbi:MAG: hypothetical protein ACREFO_01000 [Acetobacteraceae bacterium]
MADEKKAAATAPIYMPTPLSVPVKAEKPVALAPGGRPENGVHVKAPAGMETISVGGLSFARDRDGFVLPAPLVEAAKAHIRSFVDAAERLEKQTLAELKQLEREADIPGRIKSLEERLERLEGTFGAGVNRG